jgi:molybdate transport system ATP-binding protein
MLDVSLDTHLNTFHLTLDFCAEIGKTTVLLGESGAGKTTVLRLLAGLLHPQKGRIIFDGRVYYDSERHIIVAPQKRPFGYVFQDYVLFPHLNVFENVAFGLRAQHLSRQVIRQRVGAVLEQVHLVGLERRRPAQLSGGQQQRVAIARTLALQPQLFLLDEPLAALDVQTRREVRQQLRLIIAETGITTVMVTHQYLEALLFGQQILVLDHGSMIQQGGQHELRDAPRSAYVAELVGTNFFCGHIVGYETNTMGIIQLPSESPHDARIEIVATLRERSMTGSVPSIGDEAYGIGDEAYVIVDPHSITLHRTPPEGSARNIFCGKIIHILSSGDKEGHIRVSIQLDNAHSTAPLIAEITQTSAARMELQEGQTVYTTFKATEASAYT